MQVKSKSGRVFKVPDSKEDAAINKGIDADADTYALSDDEFTQLKPIKPGRPKSAQHKIATHIRLDAEVLNAFKATGKGWQTRINEALKEWLKDHAA